MKKIIVWVGVGLAAFLIAVVVVVSLFLDRAVRHGVVTYAPQYTKVNVELESVDLSLLSGSGSIRGFVLGNPEGYQTPSAIRVGQASLTLVPSSLIQDKVVVRSVRIEGPEITFEGDLKGNNISRILKNLEEATGGGTNEPSPETAGESKKLQVDEFLITGAKVNIKHTLLGQQTATVSLPDIRLASLGTGPEGITAAELTKRVLSSIDLETLKAVKETLEKSGKEVLDSGKKTLEETTDAVKGVGDRVGDLFKKKP